jgi:hypothetical protein
MASLDFLTIPKFTSKGNYLIDVPLDELSYTIQRYIDKYQLQLNPDFKEVMFGVKNSKLLMWNLF